MINNEPSKYFFAAMNTVNGFLSCFDEIFSELDRLYIIKGGPGTGKSRMMREIADAAEEAGFDTERFLCSSDPTSLDGVIIPALSVGIIDGTAPHSYEPKLPGAKDNIIDIGRFWSAEALSKERKTIEAINLSKSRLYSSVYSYLAAVGECDKITRSVSKTALQSDKLDRAVSREISNLKPKAGKPRHTVRIRSAISCDGIITLASYAEMSENRRAVLDIAGVGHEFMKRLLFESDRLGASAVVSYDPFRPDAPDAIFYPDSDIVYYIGSETDYGEKTVNMRRFIDNKLLSPFKGKLRAISRIRLLLLSQMQADFRSIKRLHAELEGIYAEAMDFEEKEAERDRVIGEMFSSI